MICPYCNYTHGWGWYPKDSNPAEDEYKKVEGEKGDFYSLSNNIKMERGYDSWNSEKASVYVCPSCRKLFIGE